MSYAGARYQPFAVVNSAFLTRQQACLCAHSYIACFELSGKSSIIWVYVVHYFMRILLSALADSGLTRLPKHTLLPNPSEVHVASRPLIQTPRQTSPTTFLQTSQHSGCRLQDSLIAQLCGSGRRRFGEHLFIILPASLCNPLPSQLRVGLHESAANVCHASASIIHARP